MGAFFTRCVPIELALKTMLACLSERVIFLPKLQRFRSYGQVESSFDNHAENFSTKGRKFFAQCPKMIIFQKNNFPQTVFLDTQRKMQF